MDDILLTHDILHIPRYYLHMDVLIYKDDTWH